MDEKETLLALLDQAVEDSKFPFWELAEENNLIVSMRLSGWRSSRGIGMLFESFGFFGKESLIATLAVLLSTFQVAHWLRTVTIFVDRTFFTEPREQESGHIQVMGRNISLSLLSIAQYRVRDEFKLPLGILLAMDQAFSHDALFGDADYLKALFSMPSDSRCLFETRHWKHPRFEDYWERGILTSRNKDFVAIANALSQNKAPLLTGKVNTSWGVQSRKLRR